ncbi:MAG TPA: helicase-related protein [Burkholderiales bacterium]|nr:helicase-related protein [Burkholderiales bacterium]
MVKKELSRIEKLELVQRQAYNAWLNSKGVGTINVATGVGKTIIAFKCLYYALKKSWIVQGSKVTFYAETEVREQTLKDEAKKFKEIYGLDVYKDFNITFVCYQANKPIEDDVKILDEIHFIGEIYAKQFENCNSYIIGLTATTSESTVVNSVTFLTKEEIINSIAPVCFRYPIDEAIRDGILSPYQTSFIYHKLDETSPYLTLSKGSRNFVTEKAYYGQKNFNKNNMRNAEYIRRKSGMEMAKLLWGLKSKVEVVKNHLRTISGKTVIFGVELAILKQITPNVVSGENTKEENQKLIDDFNSGVIDTIASAKMLKQGITLEGVENCVLVSYYSTSTDFIQRLGRIVRFVPNKLANLYIVVTQDTLEANWVSKMILVKDGSGAVTHSIDLNLKL